MNLNAAQEKATKHGTGPLLLLAGAGSGKTTTLVQRVLSLIESGVGEEHILLLTFTNKAADEMVERMSKALGRKPKLRACTFHSFCVSKLRAYYHAHDMEEAEFSIITPSDESDLIDMVKSSLGFEKQKGLPPNRVMLEFRSHAINTRSSLSQLILSTKYWGYCDIILGILECLQREKASQYLFNYDDLLTRYVEVLENDPLYQSKMNRFYDHILVDEYQDTNALQEQLLGLLRHTNLNLTVVGDDCQSIYKFRGADIHNILTFEDRYKPCTFIPLLENYRSSQEILNVANHVLTNHSTEGVKKHLHGQFSGRKPEFYRPVNNKQEVDLVIYYILSFLHTGVPAHEICVLARTSSEFAALEVELMGEGIAYDKYGGLKFMDKVCIKDMLCLLRVLLNPHDEIAWYRTLQIHPYIGKAYARKIAAECAKVGASGLRRKERRQYTPWLTKFADLLVAAGPLSLADKLSLLESYYFRTREYVIGHMRTSEDKRSRLFEDLEKAKDDVKILLGLAGDYRSGTEFLDALSLDSHPELSKDSDKLVLSTIHSVKGLEFDNVIVLNCIEEVFPSTDLSKIGTPEEQEELRCFYVAITRARKRLQIMSPEKFSKWGPFIYGKISHFIRDGLHLFTYYNAGDCVDLCCIPDDSSDQSLFGDY